MAAKRRMSRGAIALAVAMVSCVALADVVEADPANAGAESDLRVVLGHPSLTVHENESFVAQTHAEDEIGQATLVGETRDGGAFNVTTLYAPPEALEPVTIPEQLAREGVGPYTQDSPGLVLDSPEAEVITEEQAADFLPVLTSLTTETTHIAEWAPTSGAISYRITFNGDTSVQASTSLEITHLARGTSETATVESLDADGAVLYTRILPIETSAAACDASEVRPMTYQPYTTAYTHEAFIAENRVRANVLESAGCGLNPLQNFEFGGDNRSYRTPDPGVWPYDDPDYRTMVMTVINWDNPSNSRVINGRGIQPTNLYLDGVLHDTRTASYDGIVASRITASTSYASIHWSVDVANAFCWAGAIRYESDVRFYRNGTIEVVGYRRQAPVHEIYGRWNNTGTDFFRTIARLPKNGFICLNDLSCDYEQINRSLSY